MRSAGEERTSIRMSLSRSPAAGVAAAPMNKVATDMTRVDRHFKLQTSAEDFSRCVIGSLLLFWIERLLRCDAPDLLYDFRRVEVRLMGLVDTHVAGCSFLHVTGAITRPGSCVR